MKTLANTIETLAAAKTTKSTYNKVLEVAQGVTERGAIAFVQTKQLPAKSFDELVICSLCDLLSLNLQRPASMRTEMSKLVESAKNIANRQLGN